MKKLLIIFMVPAIVCCKKEKEEKPAEPVPVVVVPPRVNNMSVKLNGLDWTVKEDAAKHTKIDQGIDPGPPKKYAFIGMTSSSPYTNAIWLWSSYATGTVNLRSTGNSALYFDTAGTAFYIKSGTMTITTMDTSKTKPNKCDKFKASFSFITDSVSGNGYIIKDGVIDYEGL